MPATEFQRRLPPLPSRRRRPGRRRLRRATAVAVVVAAVVTAGVVVQLVRPVPDVRLTAGLRRLTLPGSLVLPWPAGGEAAMAVPGVGTVGSSGGTAPVPIASITKVMTALVVLQDHPLRPGQSGPTITVTPADVATYQQDLDSAQSVAAVQAGEQLTELQALQGMLIPSANNLADLLAQWDDGSVPAFVAAMNRRAAALGLHHTRFVSPTGLEPGSVSTPEDLIHLGEVAMADPVLAAVVAMPSATLPVAGTVANVDADVTHDGFVGIKTGSDTAAGGCFLFEAQVPVGGRTLPVVGAVLGQQATPILQGALDAATALVTALGPQLSVRTLVPSGVAVGRAHGRWAAGGPLVTGGRATGVGWPGMDIPVHLRLLAAGATLRRGQPVGRLTVGAGAAPQRLVVRSGRTVPGPSLGDRLTRL